MPAATKNHISLPKLPKREDAAVPRSQVERLWLISGGLVAFIMVLVGYFFFISPQRSETSDVNGQVADAKQQNAVLQGRIDALREQSQNLDKYLEQLAKANAALPTQSGISDFVRTLQSLGNATLTNVTGLTVGEPETVSQAPAGAPSIATDQTGAAGGPAAAGAPAAVSTGSAATGPVIYSMAITATVSGSASDLDKFLDQLQSVQPRAVLITQIAETSSGGTSKASLVITMQAFVSPVTTPTAPTAPAAAPTPTATATS